MESSSSKEDVVYICNPPIGSDIRWTLKGRQILQQTAFDPESIYLIHNIKAVTLSYSYSDLAPIIYNTCTIKFSDNKKIRINSYYIHNHNAYFKFLSVLHRALLANSNKIEFRRVKEVFVDWGILVFTIFLFGIGIFVADSRFEYIPITYRIAIAFILLIVVGFLYTYFKKIPQYNPHVFLRETMPVNPHFPDLD